MRALAQEMSKPKVIHTSPQGALKKPRSLFDMEIALSAALEARMTGRVPPPEEAAQKHIAWMKDVSLQNEWLQHHLDQFENAGQDPFAMNGNLNGHG